jgi:hypothetical protein
MMKERHYSITADGDLRVTECDAGATTDITSRYQFYQRHSGLSRLEAWADIEIDEHGVVRNISVSPQTNNDSIESLKEIINTIVEDIKNGQMK